MTYDELLVKIDEEYSYSANALRAVVELHRPFIREDKVVVCSQSCNHHLGYAQPYPCPTIQAIEKELG